MPLDSDAVVRPNRTEWHAPVINECEKRGHPLLTASGCPCGHRVRTLQPTAAGAALTAAIEAADRRHHVAYNALNGRWSHAYDCCVSCGTTDRPHAAHGMCDRCRMRASRHPL